MSAIQLPLLIFECGDLIHLGVDNAKLGPRSGANLKSVIYP
jgi:hypothetical protein